MNMVFRLRITNLQLLVRFFLMAEVLLELILRAVNVNVLKEIGETLINIHGQHDNQILLKSDKHIEILDNFGDIGEKLSDYQNSFKMLQETARKLSKLLLMKKKRIFA